MASSFFYFLKLPNREIQLTTRKKTKLKLLNKPGAAQRETQPTKANWVEWGKKFAKRYSRMWFPVNLLLEIEFLTLRKSSVAIARKRLNIFSSFRRVKRPCSVKFCRTAPCSEQLSARAKFPIEYNFVCVREGEEAVSSLCSTHTERTY